MKFNIPGIQKYLKVQILMRYSAQVDMYSLSAVTLFRKILQVDYFNKVNN
jgi:hypothetical protein